MIGLGIDAGGTGSRWLLRDAGGALAEGRIGPLSGHLFRPEQRAEAAELLRALAAAVGSHAAPSAVVAGVTGLDSRGREHAFLTEELAGAFGLPLAAVRVMHDTPLAYRSAFEPGEGVLLYAGTGTIAYHLAADGRELRAGGHGYIIDDAGGGFYLGQRALRFIVRLRDEQGEQGEATPLERAVAARIGDPGWDAMRNYVYGGGRSAVAALAPAVVEADRAGDAAAGQILAAAGAELARLARVLLARLGTPLPVGFAGGISRIGGTLERTLRGALPRGAELFVAEEAPVVTAARLALEAAAGAVAGGSPPPGD